MVAKIGINAKVLHNAICIVSIFVNPLQFSEKKDFESYPKTYDDDIRKINNLGVDYVFLPDPSFINDIKKILEPLVIPPTKEEDPDFYLDYGSDSSYHTKTGKGECAA